MGNPNQAAKHSVGPARGKAAAGAAGRRRWILSWAGETGLIFLVFLLYAGSLPPAVNEPHYLGKAKHFWDPSWCAGDLFLESADAHLVFNIACGWLTLLMPLPAVAWTGRVVTWLLLACGWRRLSRGVIDAPLTPVLSAGLFLCGLHYFHMAGEWVVGGVEAKGFAFALLFFALAALVRGNWRLVWPLLGAAAMFHVLVGGWGVAAAALTWLVCWKDRLSLWRMLPFVALGLLLALPGVVPGLLLTWGAEPETVRQANRLYVFERLPHHLVVRTFEPAFIVRFVCLTAAWAVLAGLEWRRVEQARLARFVSAALFIALIGAAIDLLLGSRPDVQAGLLRFYWFRLSDVAVPIGAALAAVALMERVRSGRPRAAAAVAGVMFAAVALGIGLVMYGEQQDARPPADRQSLPRSRSGPKVTYGIYLDWRRVCHWISLHTGPGDIFLTPQRQQTFKWYAGRPEAANRKDLPQDAASIVEWDARLDELYRPFREENGPVKSGLVGNDDEGLAELGRKYGAKYLLLDRTITRYRPGFIRLYPNFDYDNDSYAVYLLPAEPAE